MNIGCQGQNVIFGAVYAQKGHSKNLQRHGLHGFALDQPFINEWINCSEKWKRSETVGNMNGWKSISHIGGLPIPIYIYYACVCAHAHICTHTQHINHIMSATQYHKPTTWESLRSQPFMVMIWEWFLMFIGFTTLFWLSETPSYIGGPTTCCPHHLLIFNMWAMVNTHYMVDGHPIHNKDPYNGYYKSLWTIGWLAPINGY